MGDRLIVVLHAAGDAPCGRPAFWSVSRLVPGGGVDLGHIPMPGRRPSEGAEMLCASCGEGTGVVYRPVAVEGLVP